MPDPLLKLLQDMLSLKQMFKNMHKCLKMGVLGMRKSITLKMFKPFSNLLKMLLKTPSIKSLQMPEDSTEFPLISSEDFTDTSCHRETAK